MRPPTRYNWRGTEDGRNGIESKSFQCGYCGNQIASAQGWDGSIGGGNRIVGHIRICHECSGPTFLDSVRSEQVPGVPYGKSVKHLPEDVQALYEEARSSIAASAPTAATLCCRKILMHVAVERGAAEGQTFVAYVKHLEDNNFIPTGAKAWVDQIRTRGNEANHEILVKPRSEAEEIIDLVEMLLKVIYDYPSRVLTTPSKP